MLEENRYLPEYRENPDYRTFDGFSMHFDHPHFSPAELKDLQRELYRKNFEVLGPSILRVVRVWFDGYRNLKDSDNPLLSGRAPRMAEYARRAIPALYPAILFGPNRERRDEARSLLREIRQEIGRLSLKENLFCLATIPLSVWTWLTAKLHISQQPKLLRTEHRTAPAYGIERKVLYPQTSSPFAFPNTGSTSPLCSRSVESEHTKWFFLKVSG